MRVPPILAILVTLLLNAAWLPAQTADSSRTADSSTPPPILGIITGYHFAAHDHVEVGLGIIAPNEEGSRRTLSMALSGEMRLGGREKVLGAVLSFWSSIATKSSQGAGPVAVGIRPGMISTGIGIGYYTNFKGESTFRLRPEIVVGIGGGFSIGYGYSHVLAGEGFNGLNRHDFTFRFYLPWQK